MKKLVILFFVFISSCTLQTSVYKKVVIKYVDFEIMTPFSIRCKDFTSYFGDEIKSIEITDKEKLRIINSFVNKLEVDTERYFPDVRLIIELYQDNNKIDTLCMSNFGISYNGNAMLLPENFLTFIEKVKSNN